MQRIRFIAFASEATNLVSGDTNQVSDIFLRDATLGTTTRVTATAAVDGGASAMEANGPSYGPAISTDGNWITFHSTATNLVATTDTNNASDVFVYERATGIITRVSVVGTTQPNGDSWDASISSDGSFIAFSSDATNLVSGDTNGSTDIFVWQKSNKAITRVSVTSSGTQVTGRSAAPSISGTGQFVAFESDATTLVTSDTNAATDIFVRDRTANTTARVSLSGTSTQANKASIAPSISADGRFIAFASDATNLATGESNNARDIFVRDRTASTTMLVSVKNGGSPDGGTPDDNSAYPKLSSNGLAVAFESAASNASVGTSCKSTDIYVRDLVAPPKTWATGVSYVIGDTVIYQPDGFTYECIQANTSANTNTPPTATSLWKRPTPCGVGPWARQVQYLIGCIVTFGGKTYRCLQNHVSAIGQEPNVAPAIWRVLS